MIAITNWLIQNELPVVTDVRDLELMFYEGISVGVVRVPQGNSTGVRSLLISVKVITNIKASFPEVEQFIYTNIT